MIDPQSPEARPLYIPMLRPVYANLHTLAETQLRVITGIALLVHGVPKIVAPLSSVQLFEMMGLPFAALWSLLLSLTHFFGAILLIIGLFTRPAAFAAMITLVGTVWFHWVTLGEGYSGAEFSILWSSVLLYFAIRGANAHSVDARLGKEF